MRSVTTLQGTLADVGVREVLGLLATSGRSGVLVVNPANPLRLLMADGAIVHGGSTSTMALGRFALANGLVTAEQLEERFGLVRSRLGERQQRALDDVTVIETLLGDVPLPQLVVAVRAQAAATVFEMMMLADGEWLFTEAPTHPLAEHFAFPTATIIAAADEQVQAWPELRERVGTDATHLRRVRRLAAHQSPVVLDAIDWAALSEIDERSTVGQIAHRLGLGRPDAYAVVAGLMDRGVAERSGDALG